MQIGYRTAQTGSGAYTTLATDLASGGSDLIIWNSAPALQRRAFTAEGYGAANAVIVDEGNGIWTLSVQIRKFYTTNILARQAVATIGTALNAGLLDFRFFDVASSDATYMPQCSVNGFAPDSADGQRGVAIFFTLKLTGPLYTTTAP